MKHTLTILILIVIGGLLLWLGLSMSSSKEEETNMDTPQDTTNVETPVEGDDESVLIKVYSPQLNTTVGNPVMVEGEARGYWFFEGSAPVVVTDWDGKIIGEGYVSAEGDWMTEDFVHFSGSIAYDLPEDIYSANGTIIFKRDNPSGLPENDAAYEVPVTLTAGNVKGGVASTISAGAIACTDEQKAAQFCTQEYAPVCGYTPVQCITEPCEPIQETYGNDCTACAKPGVVAYIPGECVVE